MQQKSSESTVIQTPSFREEEFQLIVKNKIKAITSYAHSPARKHFLITTDFGFVLINPEIASFTRYENERSPFYKGSTSKCGIRLGSIIDKRAQVALVPNFSSRNFLQTIVYIYDYQMGIVLSSFDCILPIRQLSLTDKFLISSNNKRILLYDYTRGLFPHTQQRYLASYNQANNGIIRYLKLQCHLYQSNKEKPIQKQQPCECGHFVVCRLSTYLKMFYVKVTISNGVRKKQLECYDQKNGQVNSIQSLQILGSDFDFTATEDGNYLLLADDYGRRIRVYNLLQNIYQTVLHLSREPRPILNMGIITLFNKQEWVIASREKQNDEATMHFFKLGKTAITDHIESNYKRYFRLYKQLGVTEGIFKENVFLGPQYYLLKEKLCCLALQGEFCELIDLSRAGLHEKVQARDYRRLEETPFNND